MVLRAVLLINLLIVCSIFAIYVQAVHAATYEIIDLCDINPDTPGCEAAVPDAPPAGPPDAPGPAAEPPVPAASPSGDPSAGGGLFESAGAGLAGFLRAVTGPLSGFVVGLGIVSVILVIVAAVFGAFPEAVRSSVRQAYQRLFAVLRLS